MSTFFDFLLYNLALDHPPAPARCSQATGSGMKKGPLEGALFDHCSGRLLFVKTAGCVEQIRQMVNLHLPGITLRPLSAAPRQLPFHARQLYFSLELENNMRAQLESSGGFALHVAGDFSELQLNLWAIRNN